MQVVVELQADAPAAFADLPDTDASMGSSIVSTMQQMSMSFGVAAGSLVDVFPTHDVTASDFDATVSLLYASRSYLPLKVRAFVTFMTELFRKGPPWA